MTRVIRLWDLNTIVKPVNKHKVNCVRISLKSHFFWMIMACKVVNWSLITIVWMLRPKGRFTLFITLLHSTQYITMPEFPVGLPFLFFLLKQMCEWDCLASFHQWLICDFSSLFCFCPERADHLWTSVEQCEWLLRITASPLSAVLDRWAQSCSTFWAVTNSQTSGHHNL